MRTNIDFLDPLTVLETKMSINEYRQRMEGQSRTSSFGMLARGFEMLAEGDGAIGRGAAK